MSRIVKIRGIVAAGILTLAAATALASEPPAVGAPAPAFTLPSNEGKPTSLSDFKGKWVVLYFYPKDFTGG